MPSSKLIPAPTFPMFVSVDQARTLLGALLPARVVERVPLRFAYGRTLAADLVAKVSHPSVTESALDGIACRAADTLAASSATPVRLRLVGESRAGKAFVGEVGAGEAVRIYTGAPLPAGADAICPVEQLQESGDDIVLLRSASMGDVRHEAGDFQAGETVLRSGVRLTPSRVALAAALGYAEVPTLKPLKVAVMSTGDEVIEPGQPLSAGQVYNSNAYGLLGMLEEAGCETALLPAAPDSPEALELALASIGGADVLLTSGGVSMGKYDFVRDLLIEGGQVSFWKVRMRPGGPAMLGGWRGLPVFGLPGNPVSSLVVFQVIVRPALTGQPLSTLRLKAGTPFRAVPDKTAFWRAEVRSNQVFDYAKQGSGVLRSLSEAGALVIMPEGSSAEVGDEVEVVLM